ncbi:MAG: hypothetical protein ABI647_19410 [Gemmatimonadota bacterium]
MDSAGAFALFLAVGGTMVALLLGPVGQAVAKRLAGKAGSDPKSGLTTGEMAAERLADMESRLIELDGIAAHVAELEQRLEFAERLLTQHEAKPALPGDRS